jgi:cobyrinic acid a,c-diamide synthase
VSLSLAAVLRRKSLRVSVFKKGPDYIDSAWLRTVSETDCYNLDTFLVEPGMVFDTFVRIASGSEIALVEGNRGIFDGKDAHGSHSSAALSRILKAPVLLVVDASKVTRTLAAVVHGCCTFEPDVPIAGIILNRVAGQRHEKTIRDSIRESSGLPVVGAFPKINDPAGLIPSRHLGLVPPSEFEASAGLRDRLAALGAECLDLDRIMSIAQEAVPLASAAGRDEPAECPFVRIAYFHDSIFTFYYPDNLHALVSAGAELIEINSLNDPCLPDIDALYIGGGFPETQASSLSRNGSLMRAIRQAADDGLPIFAECGGLMVLGKSIRTATGTFPMAGVFPIELEMRSRPAGHGYMLLQVCADNPFFETGALLKAHEFHYSGLLSATAPATCLKVVEGYGLDGLNDGLLYKNTFASYAHFHAMSGSGWAAGLIRSARKFRAARLKELVV